MYLLITVLMRPEKIDKNDAIKVPCYGIITSFMCIWNYGRYVHVKQNILYFE